MPRIGQSIADAAQLNRGLGTAMVRAFVKKLFKDPQVTRIQTDPDPTQRAGHSPLWLL